MSSDDDGLHRKEELTAYIEVNLEVSRGADLGAVKKSS
jgi:hypothetical protein